MRSSGRNHEVRRSLPSSSMSRQYERPVTGSQSECSRGDYDSASAGAPESDKGGYAAHRGQTPVNAVLCGLAAKAKGECLATSGRSRVSANWRPLVVERSLVLKAPDERFKRRRD